MKFIVIVFCILKIIEAQKCGLTDKTILRCQNVGTLSEISSELQSGVTRLEIVNKVGGQIDVTGE